MHLIYGFGVTGEAVATFCKNHKIDYAVTDRRQVAALAPFYLEGGKLPWDQIEKVVVSPGVVLPHDFVQEAKRREIPLISEIEFAIPYLKIPVIGVTGTNGKSSTVLLLEHLIRSQGKAALACGNIGKPLIACTEIGEGCLIAELSSFQLEKTFTPFLQSAIVLNIEPNHLDHHLSMEAYIAAKAHIQKLVLEGGKVYLPAGMKSRYPEFDISHEVMMSHHVVRMVEAEARKERFHDPWQLKLAEAILIDQKIPFSLEKDLKSFSFPPYRLAYRGIFDGVKVYNDSKSTTPAATLFALSHIQEPTLLLAGGFDKQLSFDVWKERFPKSVKKVFAFGSTAVTIEKTLNGIREVLVFKTLEEAIDAALSEAQSGDALILSPGCSSQDQFSNYRARGAAFDEKLATLFCRR